MKKSSRNSNHIDSNAWNFINHRLSVEKEAYFTLHLMQCERCLNLTNKLRDIKLFMLQKKISGNLLPEQFEISEIPITPAARTVPGNRRIADNISKLAYRVEEWIKSGKINFREGIDNTREAFSNLKKLLLEDWYQLSDFIATGDKFQNDSLQPVMNEFREFGGRTNIDFLKRNEVITNLNRETFEISIKENKVKVVTSDESQKDKILTLILYHWDMVNSLEEKDYNIFRTVKIDFRKQQNSWIAEYSPVPDGYSCVIYFDLNNLKKNTKNKNMNNEIELANGKKAFLSEPFSRKQGKSFFTGRKDIIETISVAWMGSINSEPLAPVLVGPPGCGKNRIVEEIAEQREQVLYIFQGHEDVTSEDLVCSVRFADSDKKHIDYMLSPLSTAMLTGGIILIDEIAKIRPRALALLVSVLDGRSYIDSNLLGTRIKATENFRFIATTNNADLINNTMPEFLRSRLRPVIYVGFQEKAEITSIIINSFTGFDELKEAIDHFWVFWKNKYGNNMPSPRQVIQLFHLAISYSKYYGNQSIRKEDVKKSFDVLFNDNQDGNIR